MPFAAFRRVLIACALIGLTVLPSARAEGPDDYGQNKPPEAVKPWERDPAQPGKVIAHPRFRGLVNPADPNTWSRLPKLPEPGGPPVYGIWLVGPDGRLAMAPGTWIFRDSGGHEVRLPDEAVREVDGKLIGTLQRADGRVETLTEVVGDIGHPTLASAFPDNPELNGRVAGDFLLARAPDGTLTIRVNNISGRYVSDGHGGLVAVEKEMGAVRAALAKVYRVKPEQVVATTFAGAPPKLRAQRFPAIPVIPVSPGVAAADKGVVLISGGTSGIGLELARKYKALGYKVATFGRDPAKAAQWTAEFGDSGSYLVETMPTLDHDALTAFVGRVESKLGKIQILVNNAGISGPFGPIGEATGKAIAETINTNLTGTINLTSIVVDRMKLDGTRGLIINMSSGASRGVPGGSVYAASKAGVNAFTTSVNAEYRDAGIRAFSFNPGHVDTGMQASIRAADPAKFPFQKKMAELKAGGQLGNPADTAAQVAFLSEHPGEFEAGTMVEYTKVAERAAAAASPAARVLTPEILAGARKAIEGVYAKNFDGNLLRGGMPIISVNGRLIGQPKNIDELLSALEELHKAIASSEANPAVVAFGEKIFQLEKQPLGEGMAGIVYKVSGTKLALKIAKPNAIGVKSLLDEKQLADEVAAVAKKEALHVPRDLAFDPFGMFHLKEEISGEKLTDLLIRKGLIKLERAADGTSHATLAPRAVVLAAEKDDPVLKSVAREIDNLLALRRKYPGVVSDIGPDNLIVVYKDAAHTKVKAAYLVDLGPSGAVTRAKLDAVKGFDDYLGVSEGLVNRYLATGVMNPAAFEAAPAIAPPRIGGVACFRDLLRALGRVAHLHP